MTMASKQDPQDSENHDWLSLIPSLLQRRQLECTEQTIESAQALVDAGLLGAFTQANENGILSPQVEASLFESFLENDYDDALHLMTLDDKDGHPVGFAFWRELPEEEMQDWIDWENLQQRLVGEKQEEISKKAKASVQRSNTSRERMRRSLQVVRNQSIRWLEVAAESSSPAATNNSSSIKSLTASATAKNALDNMTHAWVKLELLAVHPGHFKQHIGTLLLACAMYQAHQKGEDHMILHVAGGKENVPALRLYEKFGFLPVSSGTAFVKPDRDVFVLGHVEESLQRLCWPALEVCSGGVDTCAIMAAAKKLGITFAGALTVITGDESPDQSFAQACAEEHGLCHEIVRLTSEELVGHYLPSTVELLEIFNGMLLRNSLVIAAVFQKAAELGYKDVVVGDGADELFGGYSFMWRHTDPVIWRQRRDAMCAEWTFSTQQLAQKYYVKSHSPYCEPTTVAWAIANTERVDCVGIRPIRTVHKGPTSYCETGKIVLREAYETVSSWRRKDPIEVGSGITSLLGGTSLG